MAKGLSQCVPAAVGAQLGRGFSARCQNDPLCQHLFPIAGTETETGLLPDDFRGIPVTGHFPAQTFQLFHQQRQH